ncbi:NAD(P)-dependent oxidoreductase [Desertimonas flava]|uniref:NAD(P)-dependent oxidoreductase n=1 Tax=Desertimonas flava TaxID=2064846 RepID=UPI000E34FEA9|nr:NAD(P)-dependent oxidoreductase [Desertimonas flava]
MTPPSPTRVVVVDPITTIRWDYDHEADELARHGVELLLPADEREVETMVPTADLLVASGRLSDHLLRAAERACAVLCYSVGMDGVNRALADELGIEVSNVPGYCTEEVADHAITLLLAAQRMLVPCATLAARGEWQVRDRDDFYRIRRVAETTVGVVGLGRIGSRFAEKARGLGMTTIAHDPYLVESPHHDVELLGLDDLLQRADAVVLCAALSEESTGLIGARELDLMDPGAILVNVARGGLVDEGALADALRAGRLRAAALDVRNPEPPTADDPLRGLDNVVLTQHTAATSVEAFRDMHHFAARRIIELLTAHGRLPASLATGAGDA